MQRILKHREVAAMRACVMAVLLVASALSWSTASGQLPTPLPQPNVNLLTSGYVLATARLPDGSVVIGGQFVSINGVLRSNIAKRLSDGTLDPNWHPSIDGTVAALAVDGDGNVYAGGEFTHTDGYFRRNLVKISPAGSVVADWDPSPDGLVQTVLVGTAGEAFVGGWFDNIGGLARSKLAKISVSSGTADPQWNPAPAPANAITSLRFSHDGQLYVGGQFQGIGDFPQRRNIAKVSMTGAGAVDPDWGPSPNTTVTDIAVAPNGDVFVAGEFTQFGATLKLYRWSVAKLSGVGNGDPIAEWDPFDSAQYNVARHVVVSDDGWVYLSGGLTYFSQPGNVPQAILRVSAEGAGTVDTSWKPGVNGDVYSISTNADKVYAGGQISDVAGQVRLGFVALDAYANPESPFDAEAPGGSNVATARQPDGRLIVSGQFGKANGQLRRGLLRLNTDGSLDMGWNPSPDGTVSAIAFATDGSVIVGGYFSQIGGQPLNAIAKLSSVDGTADPMWKPALAGYVRTIISDNAGFIYAGGTFSHGTGAAYQRNLVRIGEGGIGEVDPEWVPDPNGEVQVLSLDGHGALFVRGNFLTMNGEPRKRIAKLLTTEPTVLDPFWNPQPGGQMYQIVADGLGSVYVVGGYFPIAGGGSTAAIAKLSTSGVGVADPLWRPFTDRFARRIAVDTANSSLYAFSTIYDPTTGIDSPYLSKHSTNGNGETDPTWNPTVNDFVSTMRVDGGRLLLGGYFTQVSGQQRYGLAALPLIVPDVILSDGFDGTP